MNLEYGDPKQSLQQMHWKTTIIYAPGQRIMNQDLIQ
jgi:hypothetical protein